MNKLSLFFLTLCALILFVIYRPWFVSEEIIGGDWPYYTEEFHETIPIIPPSWSPIHGNGFGGHIPGYALDSYIFFLSGFFVKTAGISWVLIYKTFIFGLFIFLSAFSSSLLVRRLFPQIPLRFRLIGSLFYTANTYILMVAGGGQMGIALSYSVAPLVVISYILLIDGIFADAKWNYRNLFFSTSALSLSLLFDARIAFVAMIAVLFYSIYSFLSMGKLTLRESKRYVFVVFNIGVTLILTCLLHSYWILPLVVYRTNPLPQGYMSTEAFEFFSFAPFSQAFTLLHPNWPENLFGKIYFMRPEFLFLPLIAFSSLLSGLLKKRESIHGKYLLFFIFLSVIGAFLAKGITEPFGFINVFLYEHVPGFSLFRDPTKWYVLIILSYTVLLPIGSFSLTERLSKFLEKKKIPDSGKIYFSMAVPLAVVCYFAFLLLPGIKGELTGTLSHSKVPHEYKKLETFIASQPEFFRTLWVPRMQRFAPHSYAHPSSEAMPLFQVQDLNSTLRMLQREGTGDDLSEMGIKYVAVPYDSLGEIFLDDRKYDERQYKKTIQVLNTLPWLNKIEGYGRIAVYELESYSPRFTIDNEPILPTESSADGYTFQLGNNKGGTLSFLEKYSPYWKPSSGILSETENGLMSVKVTNGTRSLGIQYEQTQGYINGRLITLVTFLAGSIFLILRRKNIV